MPQLNANEEKAARDKLSGEISDLKKQIVSTPEEATQKFRPTHNPCH